MASKNARLQSVRLMKADLEAVSEIATKTGKTKNAVIVEAIRARILETKSDDKGEADE